MHRPGPSAPPTLLGGISARLERFLHIEAASGVVLLICAAFALIWANSPWAAGYEALQHTPFTIGVGSLEFERSLHFWINEGLMTIFFLVIGLEIRREMHEGTLSRLPLAALPLSAALGGVLVPAVIYVAINPELPPRAGWAIPTATDIAFAVGVLAVLGSRVPPALRTLLLALAIIDDVVAILIIALFYSGSLDWLGLLIAASGVVLTLVFQRLEVRRAPVYIVPGALVWVGLLYAGVHPTLAGVVLGLLTPVSGPARSDTVIGKARDTLDEIAERMSVHNTNRQEITQRVRELGRMPREILPPVVTVEAALHPWVAYGIMPLFAFANAGVHFGGLTFDGAGTSVAAGIVAGLLLGKPLGIVLAAWLAVRMRLAEMHASISWRGVVLVGLLGGIGFTMSIFIATLAFRDAALLSIAKFAVLVGSTLAGVAALLYGRLLLPGATQAVASPVESTQERIRA